MPMIQTHRNALIQKWLGNVDPTPPATWYFGVSTTPINNDGSGVTEPAASTGYTRITIPNNLNSWNDATNGIVTNKIRLEFPELQADAGTAVWYFLAPAATGNAAWMDRFTTSRTLAQYTTLFVNPGEAQFIISNTTT